MRTEVEKIEAQESAAGKAEAVDGGARTKKQENRVEVNGSTGKRDPKKVKKA